MLPKILIVAALVIGLFFLVGFFLRSNPIAPLKEGKITSSQPKRIYPEFIKCSWVPAPQVTEVAEKLDQLKELGFNTICIMPPLLAINPDKEVMQRFNSSLVTTLPKIKKGGFAIFIALDDTPEGLEAARKQRLTSEQLSTYFEKEALEWAIIAEQNQVEYFSPANELQSRLKILKTAYTSEAEAIQQAVDETNTWHQNMLPKLRKVFHGKLVAKFGDYTPGLKADGYDLFGYTIGYGYSSDLDTFRQKVKETYNSSINSSKQEGNNWLVSEVYLPHTPQSQKPPAIQDDYYKITIEEITVLSAEDRPKGFIATGYGPGGFTQLTDETIAVIKDFFLAN